MRAMAGVAGRAERVEVGILAENTRLIPARIPNDVRGLVLLLHRKHLHAIVGRVSDVHPTVSLVD